MSGEVKTYLINDERINVESEVEIAVKKLDSVRHRSKIPAIVPEQFKRDVQH